jgi:hypothetical protein
MSVGAGLMICGANYLLSSRVNERMQSEIARIPNLAKPGNTLLYRFKERRLWPRIESISRVKVRLCLRVDVNQCAC